MVFRPKRVSYSEWPEFDIDELDDDVLDQALSSLVYCRCPACETEQWLNSPSGQNTRCDCTACDAELFL